MSEAQAVEIRELKQKVSDLEDKVEALDALRNQLIGMGTFAKWGIRLLILLGGTGAIDIATRIVQWLSQPMKHP